MAFSLEALYAFFSPPASRNSSPQGSPSVFSSTFFTAEKSIPPNTKQTDLPMPPSSAFTATNMPSPAESSTSIQLSEERDFSPPMSPYPAHRSGSMSSGTSTAPSSTSDLHQDDEGGRPAGPHRAATTLASQTTEEQQLQLQRPAAPRRSATEVGPLEPLSRTFPAPTHEPSLDELLARKPGKWSLGHYVKNARVREVVGGEDEEQRAKKFENIKRDLLRSKGEIEGVLSKRE